MPNAPEPIVVKESDYNAKKEEEKERRVYGNGLSSGDILKYVEKMRPRLRAGKHVDVTKKFKSYSSVVREVEKNYIRVLSLEDISFAGDDMSRVNFALSNLKGANFSGSKLQNSVFAYADLQNANFKGANLKGADFTGANLISADFTGARIDGTNFYKADIQALKAVNPKTLEKIKKSVEFYRVQQ